MAEVQVIPMGGKTVSIAMRVSVQGRVESVKTYDGKRFTKIMTPAADSYSQPQIVEVRSKCQVGARGDEVAVTCTLGGYNGRPYEAKDRSSGEVVKVVPVFMTLDLIED